MKDQLSFLNSVYEGTIISDGTNTTVAMTVSSVDEMVISAVNDGNLTKFTGDKMYMDDISNMNFFVQWRNLHHDIDTTSKGRSRNLTENNEVDFILYYGPSPNGPSWAYEIKLNKDCEVKLQDIDSFYEMFFGVVKNDLESYLDRGDYRSLRNAFEKVKENFNDNYSSIDLGRTTEKLLNKFEHGGGDAISLRFGYTISKLILSSNFVELGNSVSAIINNKELKNYFYTGNLQGERCISCDIGICHTKKNNNRWKTNIELQFQSVFTREFSVPDNDVLSYPFMSWTINYHLNATRNGISINGRSLLDYLVVEKQSQIVEDLKRLASALKNTTP